MRLRDISEVLNIGSDCEVIIHCTDKGNAFIKSAIDVSEMQNYGGMIVTGITVSGYGGAYLYIDVKHG